MSVKESLGTRVKDTRTLLIVIFVIAILWRAVISLDGKIALWESMCSGIALFVMGWALCGYIFVLPRELKGWLELNRIYHWIAISLIAINTYVVVYYVMRWYRLADIGGLEEALVPLDFFLENCKIHFVSCILLRGNMVSEVSEKGA